MRGGVELFDDDCIFYLCSDDVVKKLLSAFLHHDCDMGWSVSCELSKILSKRGRLVAEIAEPIVTRPIEYGFSDTFLFLSYFANSPSWEPSCIDYLDHVPEDSRDGLLLACYRLNTLRIYEKLVKKFTEWCNDDSWDSGSGEWHLLRQFIKKWDQKPTFLIHNELRNMLLIREKKVF